MSSLANTIRREDEAARTKQARIEADAEERNRHGRVMTAFENPPIPIRAWDWSAWIDGQEEGATGRGRTEEAAIADLLEQLDEAQEAPVQYTVTMTSEQYQRVYGVILHAEIEFGARAKASAYGDLAREFALQDHAEAAAAMAILDSLNYEVKR